MLFRSSGMGNTNNELRGSCKNAILIEGERLDANISSERLKLWADLKMKKES